jgi:hypothetical protein
MAFLTSHVRVYHRRKPHVSSFNIFGNVIFKSLAISLQASPLIALFERRLLIHTDVFFERFRLEPPIHFSTVIERTSGALYECYDFIASLRIIVILRSESNGFSNEG